MGFCGAAKKRVKRWVSVLHVLSSERPILLSLSKHDHFRKFLCDFALNNPKMAEATLHKILRAKAVRSVAFSLDGKLIASASRDKTVRLWNISNGELNTELKGHTDLVESVAFSPDGKSIVSGGWDKTVRTWSIATKQQVEILYGHSDWVRSVAWSPKGDVIASCSYDATVILWDAVSGSAKKELTKHRDEVTSVSFSQNGKKLASASRWDKTAIIWDVDSGAALITLTHSSIVWSVCFSPDDQFVVTSCNDGIVHMFNANTGHEEKRFKGHKNSVNSVAFSFDGSIIVSGGGCFLGFQDNSVRLWDVASTKQLQKLNGHTSAVCSIALSRDGKFIASAGDKTIRLWNTPSSLQRAMEAQKRLEVGQEEIDKNSLRECVCCQEIKDAGYLLPCLHAACFQCVDNFVKEAKSCCCACGEKFAQDQLTTVPSATLLTPTCFDCDEPTTHYCGECENNMCKAHTEAHRLSKRTKDHVVRPITEAPSCHKHSTETALAFCTHCKALICGDCSIAEHSKLPHHSVTLQEAAKITPESLKIDIAKLFEFVLSINKNIKQHKYNRTKLEKERSKLEAENAELQAKIKKLQAKITERQAKIADVRSQEKVTTLQIEDLENTKGLVLTTRKQANTLAATAPTLPDATLVRLQSVITSRVTQLQTGLDSISGFEH